MVNGKVAGPLVQVAATTDPDATTLSLRFPDGPMVDGPVELGARGRDELLRPAGRRPASSEDRSRRRCRRSPGGRSGSSASDEPGAGSDRGTDASVSLVSRGTLDLLAREAGEDAHRRPAVPDALRGSTGSTRTRRTPGSAVGSRFGDAVVRLHALVGRCAVTTHDPDTGVTDLDTLRIIRRYRADVESEEPLPIGVWGSVEQPGRVRVGDPVEPL